jgi:hypothetical protein
MRFLSSIIMVAVISLLCISPSLARNNSLKSAQENWNRQADNRRDRQEQRQEQWNDRREYRRDQWNNMRDRTRANFNRGGGRRGGEHNGRGHH